MLLRLAHHVATEAPNVRHPSLSGEAPGRGRLIEGRPGEVGAILFRPVLEASDDARDIWALVREPPFGTRGTRS